MSTIQATADAPPVINESATPMSVLIAKLHALPTGQAIRYQPTGKHQRNPDLFIVDLKLAIGSEGIFTFIPTSDGVIITKQ